MTAVSVGSREAISRSGGGPTSKRSKGTAPALTRVADGINLIEPGRFRALGRLGQNPCPGDQHRGSAVTEEEGHFGSREHDVERHHGTARLEDPEVGDQELRDVRQLQRDAVAGLYPGRGQGRREPVGRLVKLGVGQLAAVVYGDRTLRC